jgi:hypothetical protein
MSSRRWLNSPFGRYARHRINAKRRGVPFHLTFGEWCACWHVSGHWEHRGRGRGQYVMARLDHARGYEMGNVTIMLSEACGWTHNIGKIRHEIHDAA